MTSNDFGKQCCIGNAVRERTNLVEAAGKSNQAVAADQTVRWLHANNSA